MIDIKLVADIMARAKDKYYNSDRFLKLTRAEQKTLGEQVPRVLPLLDNGYVTDKAYDKLEYYFKKYGGKVDIGAPVREGKTKVKLPVRMTSLDKGRPSTGEVSKFAAKNKGPYVGSPKLDGVSIELEYERGQLVRAYNRGDGTIGQDISFLIPYLNVPTKISTSIKIVRAEGIMKNSTFDKHWAEKYRNARNLTSGVFNKKGKHEALEHIDVVCYEILSPRTLPLDKQLAELKRAGFDVVPHVTMSRISDSVLTSLYNKFRAKLPYTLDGVVVVDNGIHKIPSSGNPSYAFAFKEEGEDNLAQSKVVRVEWNPSKHGYLKPRVEIEPVELSGVTVTYANGFNAYFIRNGYVFKDRAKHGGREYPVGPGAIIELTRSGEVIPDIQRVIKPARKPALPGKEFGDVHWTDSGIDLVLDEGHGNETVAVKKIATFLTNGLGVEHLASGMVAKMYAAGFKTIHDFLNADYDDFMSVPGIKSTLANKFYNQISTKMRAADLASVAANSGFFGTTIGAKKIQSVIDEVDILKLPYRDVEAVEQRVAQVRGFKATARKFAEGLKQFRPWIKTLPIKFVKAKAIELEGNALEGQSVCFTGFRDEDLARFIKGQGGKIATSVTGTTTILVTNDPNSATGKAQKARQLGIKIYTPEQFTKRYKL